jgi:hypothetical protein
VGENHSLKQINMIADLEKTRRILHKTFCFMQWQTDDAIKRGEEVMGIEDIEFLLSLDGIGKGEVLPFKSDKEDSYNFENLFRAIKMARKKKLKGVVMETTLTQEDNIRLKKIGVFIKYAGYQAVLWDEIYLSEEAFMESEISDFKNLFGCLATASKPDKHGISLI